MNHAGHRFDRRELLYVKGSDGVCYLPDTDMPAEVFPVSRHYRCGVVEMITQPDYAPFGESDDDSDSFYSSDSDSDMDADDEEEEVYVAPHNMSAIIEVL